MNFFFEGPTRINALRKQLDAIREEIRCSVSPEDRDLLLDEAVATIKRLRELEADRG